jgi:RHS repeat-associated protein
MRTPGGVYYYLHTDHLGSTSLTTDESGEVVSRQLYHPFGTVRYSEGTNPTDFGFTGQKAVPGTGLLFYHARYYHPALGRFVSADTIVPKPFDPQGWNRYAYAVNNPLRYIDPSGHDWGDIVDTVRGHFGAAVNNTIVAATIVQHPDASFGQKAGAAAYLAVTGFGVGCLVVGGAILVWEAGAAVASSVAGTQAATTAGTAATAACADGDCTNEVRVVGDAARAICADGDCTNEAAAAGQAARQGLNAFSRAAEFGIRSYNELRGAIRGAGLQAHHIIEQRFAERLGLKAGQMQSVALTPEEHQAFTNVWRSLIGYARDNAAVTTLSATQADIWAAAQEIYANYPDLLEAARQTLFGQ